MMRENPSVRYPWDFSFSHSKVFSWDKQNNIRKIASPLPKISNKGCFLSGIDKNKQ